MDGYDPAKPFRLYSAPSPGVSEGNRGGSLHCASYETLDEAKRATRNLEPGYSLSCITYGPGSGEVVWPA
jgi:hypothetical protein